MEENLKNKLGFWTFFIIVLTLGIGGYFVMQYALNDPKEKDSTTKEKVSYKIDKEQDYIYFINEDIISESAELYYKDVVINLNTQEVLTETLEKENEIYKRNIQYLSDVDLISDEIITYNNDNLYALTFRKYETYEYNNYVSLIVNDFNYSCFDLVTFNKTKSYIFDTETGLLLTEEEILKLYDQSIDKLKEQIKNYLTSKQSVIDEVEVIKIDETINDLSNYSLYINEYGKLCISFLVKTTQVDYNEIMEVS